jgi:uncharacterized membrane protein YcgQ (UPF0703/DUF1980 family)
MKKKLFLALCALSLLALTACGEGDTAASRADNSQSSVSSVIDAQIEKAEAGDAASDAAASSPAEEGGDTGPSPAANEEEVEVDLTALSSTVVYSEVYNMMVMPENYIGKTVKMRGDYAVYHDEATGNNYFACIIKDATACCANGIEFVLTDDYSYPQDYPAEGEEITVVGTFDTYDENGSIYCTLRNAVLL